MFLDYKHYNVSLSLRFEYLVRTNCVLSFLGLAYAHRKDDVCLWTIDASNADASIYV